MPDFNSEPAVTLLQELVAIPSVNPKFSDPDHLKGEHRLSEALAEKLRKLGFSILSLPRKGEMQNFLARFGADKPALRVTFEMHLDTVGVRSMKIAPFAAEIRNARIWGRGTADCKGPIAALLSALQQADLGALEQAGIAIDIIGAVREESGNEGAEALARSGYRTDWLLVLEPTELDVIYSHKGAFWFSVRLEGKAAHGSDPARGINAIDGMLELARRLKDLTQQTAARLRDPHLGSPTINFGVIQGGEALNIVASHCFMEVDRRTLPAEDPGELEEQIRRILNELAQKQLICAGELTILKERPAFQGQADSPLVRHLLASSARVGHHARKRAVSWYSDAGVLSAIARHTLVFGPGSIAEAHTDRESIAVDELLSGARIVKAFIQGLPDAVGEVE